MPFEMFMPVRLVWGEGAVNADPAKFSQLGSNCLIVTGRHSASASGALGDARRALEAVGVAYTLYDNIGQNPLISACHEAGALAREVGAQFILGIGGGSPLDAAKAVGAYASNPQLEARDIYKKVFARAPLPVALIGTTAGTGSEVTAVSVLTDDATGRKKSISGPAFYAAVAFADPKYTYSLDYDFTVSTALDAFAHNIEAWFTPRCGGVLKTLAAEGFRLLWPSLLELKNSGTVPGDAGRANLYYGSIYAGMVINNCGTAFPHPVGYILTESCGVPHGKACAAFLPAFLARAKRFAPAALGEAFSIMGEDFDSLLSTLRELTNLQHFGFSAEQAETYAARWQEEPPLNFKSSPGSLTAGEAAELLTQI